MEEDPVLQQLSNLRPRGLSKDFSLYQEEPVGNDIPSILSRSSARTPARKSGAGFLRGRGIVSLHRRRWRVRLLQSFDAALQRYGQTGRRTSHHLWSRRLRSSHHNMVHISVVAEEETVRFKGEKTTQRVFIALAESEGLLFGQPAEVPSHAPLQCEP